VIAHFDLEPVDPLVAPVGEPDEGAIGDEATAPPPYSWNQASLALNPSGKTSESDPFAQETDDLQTPAPRAASLEPVHYYRAVDQTSTNSCNTTRQHRCITGDGHDP
jgi:hypothetical protein